jgi:hypothetical protein
VSQNKGDNEVILGNALEVYMEHMGGDSYWMVNIWF